MCGINGLILKEDHPQLNLKIRQMNDFIIHRGPDDDGVYQRDDRIAMGMRRLSIIDLTTGKQPIYSDDQQKVIVFNGEIYNYKTLRRELVEAGVDFKTTSDTEVILKLYEKYGTASFSMLDGMFAFSIYDANLNKVIIARDFFGEKPLYYANFQDAFYWASELKSIVKVLPVKPMISLTAVNLYFQLTYIPAPYTIYEEVHKLEPNHYLEFDCVDFSFSLKEIEQNFKKTEIETDLSSVKEKVYQLVSDSVQSRTIADVPIGTFLSGGVDSSIVSLCVAQQSTNKIDTFSIGFEKKEFDESAKAREVAKMIGSNHHEFIIGEQDLLANINEIVLNFDEPFADSSALASYLVAQKTSKHVKVALTGDGGDEVFGGYNKYYIGKLNSRYTSLIPRSLHNVLKSAISPLLSTKDDNRGKRFKINKLMNSINYGEDFYYNIISLGFQEADAKKLLTQSLFSGNVLAYYKNKVDYRSQTLTDFRNIDRHLSLEGDMLVKVDRTSMLSSLECRSPFLNKELWNFANTLPERYLINGWDKKHILKKSFETYFPKDFLDKRKKGFEVPVGDWLKSSLKKELLTYVEKSFIQTQGIFNYDVINELIVDHISGKIDNTFKVWSIFCFQKWYKEIYNNS
ncbi:asparagine synthase (glutamine-hydrolyzing) [Pedobacter sp. Hv1]|uniref:asparagine synthase (glutamine-hydrolyzing) n=1 Tax=Pedobacter sp. Hv1 TaxID=1740090 RepID=UPI0006D8B475|nr:asparagine synthase (glutamine-hydrolyzing) [Pedobacter sp. Hv1]KQB99632.1 asparagine synthase [Pedobacter sp. Hv1]